MNPIKPNIVSVTDIAKFDRTFNEYEFFKTLHISAINRNPKKPLSSQIIIVELRYIECDCKGTELKRGVTRFVAHSMLTFKMFLQHICANLECFPSDILFFRIYESLTANINLQTRLVDIFVGDILSREIVEIVVRNDAPNEPPPICNNMQMKIDIANEICELRDEQISKVSRVA